MHERSHIDYDRVAIVRTLLTTSSLLLALTIVQIANPSVAALYEDALVYESGSAITSNGALSAYSGAKTGRSPSDKRIVQESVSSGDVWWGPVNKPMSTEVRFAFEFPVSRRSLVPMSKPTFSTASMLRSGQRSSLRTLGQRILVADMERLQDRDAFADETPHYANGFVSSGLIFPAVTCAKPRLLSHPGTRWESR